jgi:hypothetical protein
MKRNIIQFKDNAFYSVVAVPTTQLERLALQYLKYACIDEWGLYHPEWLPTHFQNWLFEKYYLPDEWDRFISDTATPSNEMVILWAYEYFKKWRKLAWLREKYAIK